MNRGFYLSLEALLSLIALTALIAIPAGQPATTLDDLYVFQKENDALKVWAAQGLPGEEEMAGDVAFVFPGQYAELMVNGKIIAVGTPKGTGTGISSELHFFDSALNEHVVRLTVFTD